MKAKTLCSTFIVVALLAMAPLELSAQTLGMVADNTTGSVTVFDADTHVVLGTVPIPLASATGDVLITPDLKLGFVTNFNHQVFVINLTTSPPSLAGGTNPIPISNPGVDLAISTDGKFLIVADGITNGTEPTSVIDIAARAEISTFLFDTSSDITSVDVCTDGSVLATVLSTSGSDTVRRLTLSADGTLAGTGEVLSANSLLNVYCAPGARSGVTMGFFVSFIGVPPLTSFTIPGLAAVDTRSLSGVDAGMSGAINPSGNRVFVRSSPPGSIDVFSFNSATGALGANPLLTIPVADALFFFGIEQIALHPNGTKLFVSEPGAVDVYNASTGALLTSITNTNIVTPTGVFVSGLAQVQVIVDIKPGSFPNSINPRSKGVIPVAILTTDTFDATTVDPLSVRFGPSGAMEAHRKGHIEDVDADGDSDLVLHFRTQETGIRCGDTSASLTGKTFNGQAIEGSDSIKTVGCK